MRHENSGMQDVPAGPRSGIVAVRSETDLQQPDLRALFNHWKDRAGDRPAPARADFDVLELKPWLSHLQLVDLTDDRMDIRYRVIGTWIVERFGHDDTGKTIEEIGLNDRTVEVRSEFLAAAESMTPCAVTRPFYDLHSIKTFTQAERLFLPLSSDGRSCDKVLSGIYYLDQDL